MNRRTNPRRPRQSHRESQVRELFSGVYICGECDREWEFRHSKELECPDCGSDDLELVEIGEDDWEADSEEGDNEGAGDEDEQTE